MPSIEVLKLALLKTITNTKTITKTRTHSISKQADYDNGDGEDFGWE